jgi:hypothetical protein
MRPPTPDSMTAERQHEQLVVVRPAQGRDPALSRRSQQAVASGSTVGSGVGAGGGEALSSQGDVAELKFDQVVVQVEAV